MDESRDSKGLDSRLLMSIGESDLKSCDGTQSSAEVPHLIDKWWKAFLVQGMPIIIMASIYSVFEEQNNQVLKLSSTIGCLTACLIFMIIGAHGIFEKMLNHRDRLLLDTAAFKKVFDRIDFDSSGTLDKHELVSAMRVLGQHLTQESSDEIMLNATNTDGEVHLSFDDFVGIMRKVARHDLGNFGFVILGSSDALTPDNLAAFMLGTQAPYRPWEARGLVILPLSVAAVGLSITFAIAKFYLEADNGLCLLLGLYGMSVGAAGGYVGRVVYFPYMMVCMQVGEVVKDRIGLWDKSDDSLREMQGLSFTGCSVFGIAGALGITGLFLLPEVPFWLPVVGTAFVLVALLSILVAPIMPVIGILNEKKSDLKAKMAAMIEAQSNLVVHKFEKHESSDFEVKQLQNMLKQEEMIAKVVVFPAGLEIFFTGAFSAAVAMAPLVLSQLSSYL